MSHPPRLRLLVVPPGPPSYPPGLSGSAHGPRSTLRFRFRRISTKELTRFTRSFAVLIDARLSLVEALETCASTSPRPPMREVLSAVRADVRQGKSLSESLARHPAVFDDLYVGLARVGEAAGVLDQVFLRLAEHLERTAAVRRRMQAAMVYPALVLTVAVAAVAFFLTTIVPTFADLFAAFGADLPAPTRLVIRLSAGLGDHAVLAGLSLLVPTTVLFGARRHPRGRMFLDRLRLRLPFAGRIVRLGLMARLCRTLGTLLGGGVPLLDALGLLAQGTGNRVLDRTLRQATSRVRRGASLHRTLQNGTLFPPMVVQMIAVGETTAALDRTLLHAAAHFERELDAAVETLTAVLEPALILFIGLVVGGILAAMYLPMFELVDVVR